jgi:type VI secretion system protein ImpG
MDDPLLQYYERELTFLRESGAEFAEKYPKIAGRLLLEPDRCEDPHTERLLEAFAFLTGRIRKKIDDAFPELTESILQIVYPHYTRPLPALTMVQFRPRLANVPPSGFRIERGTRLFSSPIQETRLTFTTTQAVQLLPLEIVKAAVAFPKNPGVGAESGIKIAFKAAPKLTLERIGWPEKIRLSLNGHQQHVFKMYELIMNNTVSVEIESFSDRDGIRKARDLERLRPEDIRAGGFSRDDALLSWPEQSFDGYRLLYEYFAFPEKFLFFDVGGTARLKAMRGNVFEIRIFFNCKNAERLFINRDTFALYTTPAINLFKQIALPVRIEHRKTQYPIYHDIHTKMTTEVFSIDQVKGISEDNRPCRLYQPFYSLDHHGERQETGVYWHIHRRKSPRKDDEGLDALISFTDAGLAAAQPECAALTIHTTCTNRDLPARLTPGGLSNDFTMEQECPITGIRCMMNPTRPRRPRAGSRLQWRLISHLSLNYLSLVEKNGRGLKELLSLYDIHDSPVTRQQIGGIESVAYAHVTMRLHRAFCRGIEVTLLLNEDKFVGSSAFLFASILERFLAQYVSINSFSRTVLKSLQRAEVVKAWPPRNGNRILL